MAFWGKEEEMMLKKVLWVLLVVGTIMTNTNDILFADNLNKLILEEDIFSNTYKRNGETISWSEAKETLRSDPKASAELDKANTFKIWAVISEVGMCAIIASRIRDYSVHNSSIDSRSKRHFMEGIVSVTALAIILQWQADSHFRNAFDVYNSKLEAKKRTIL